MFALAFAVLAFGTPGATLYDGTSDKTPQQSPWTWGLVGSGGNVTPPMGTGKVTLDTTADPSGQIGWLNVSPLAMNPASRPVVTFDLRMVSETHFSFDRAGLSVIVIASDKKGIELSFWDDRVWVQNDNPIFTHGEEAFIDTKAFGSGKAGLRRYALTFSGTFYRLSVDGQQILSGLRRDYSAFTGFPDPYEIPNVLWVGDDTHSAQAKFEFSWFAVNIGATMIGSGIKRDPH